MFTGGHPSVLWPSGARVPRPTLARNPVKEEGAAKVNAMAGGRRKLQKQQGDDGVMP